MFRVGGTYKSSSPSQHLVADAYSFFTFRIIGGQLPAVETIGVLSYKLL